MQEFLDANNQLVRIRLTVGVAERVLSELGVNLFDCGKQLPELLAGDAIRLLKVIGLMAVQPGIVIDLDGATLELAVEAFAKEIAHFFLEAGRKTESRLVLESLSLSKSSDEKIATMLARMSDLIQTEELTTDA